MWADIVKWLQKTKEKFVFISNKKENIIWKDNGNGGMWDGMND